MDAGIVIRELRDDERSWAGARYREIAFAATPPGSVALVAERGGQRVGLGRLVEHAPGVVELGGIWTAEAARGAGVARAMVAALLARPELAWPDGRFARGPLWCIPFGHLRAFYGSFGFIDRAPPWPAEIAGKVAALVAQGLAICVLARSIARRARGAPRICH